MADVHTQLQRVSSSITGFVMLDEESSGFLTTFCLFGPQYKEFSTGRYSSLYDCELFPPLSSPGCHRDTHMKIKKSVSHLLFTVWDQ